MAHQGRRRSTTLAFILTVVAVAPLLSVYAPREATSPRGDGENDSAHRRSLTALPAPAANPLARFFDPKSVSLRQPVANAGFYTVDGGAPTSGRESCQIIYVLGVEGSIHHGFVPVVRRLAEAQVDPITGTPYHVVKGHAALRNAIFGFKGLGEKSPPLNDPKLVQDTVHEMCPPSSESWRRHVVIEGNSFPSSGHFRVKRQREWSQMSPEEIAADALAINHPTNLFQFASAYSPSVDVKFIVLHRPYLETIASHPSFDGGPEGHSNVIGGFLLILRRFLTSHLYSATNSPLWTMVCADKLSSKQYPNEHSLTVAREHVIRHLADFMGWPVKTCPSCFDEWKESGKASPAERLGRDATNVVMGHMERLVGIWPPRREEDGLPEQQCEL